MTIVGDFKSINRRLRELRGGNVATKSARIGARAVFDRGLLQKAIDDPNHLIHSMEWGLTEEGADYWYKIYKKGHTEESKQKLRDIIEEYDRNERRTTHPHP